jgi:serine/threonine-protein kinase RsbW
MGPGYEHRMTLANDFAALEQLARETEEFLELHAVGPEAGYAVQLTLEEIVTNIIKYGFDDEAEHAIEVRMSIGNGGRGALVLQVEDNGHPFNPLEGPAPDLDGGVDERAVGGLGLHLVRQMADRVDYVRANDRNRIEILIRRDGHGAA